MKHLFTGVALAALVGLAPLAMAQTGGSASETPENGKAAIKNERATNSQSGATVGTPRRGTTTTQGSDMAGSAGNRGAAEGTKAAGGNATAGGNAGTANSMSNSNSTGSVGTSSGDRSMKSGMSGDHMTGKKSARHGMSSSGSGSTMGRGSQSADSDTTRQLNQQELGRLRSGGG